MKTLLTTVYVILFSITYPLYSQDTTNNGRPRHEKKSLVDSIRTQVFILSTCEPNSVILYRKLGEQDKRKHIRKLEVHSNKPNSFMIEGVNPLRYRYFINNEAVTQYIEKDPSTVTINTFGTVDAWTEVPEIKMPELFKTDSIKSKSKEKLRQLKLAATIWSDSLSKKTNQLNKAWNDKIAILSRNKNDTIDRNRPISYYDALQKYKQENAKLLGEQNYFRTKREAAFREYYSFVNSLPINNADSPMLKKYRGYITLYPQANDIEFHDIRKMQFDFAFDYSENCKKLTDIDKALTEYESQGYMSDTTWKKFRQNTEHYKITWKWGPEGATSYRQGDNFEDLTQNVSDDIFFIRELILQQKIKLYEEFIVNLIMNIGMTMQVEFRTNSKLNNEILSLSCIDDNMLHEIDKARKKLERTFHFIQETGTEMQIMVTYLDIDSDLYKEIAKKINSNYVVLLNYLKNYNYVTKDNTKQFTLPTHGNLKNIDLIRYKIERHDRVTNSKQLYNYDFWLKGGLKVDFSIALLASRLTDDTYNKVLKATANDVDSIRIVKQASGRADFAFGGMVNVTPRNGARWMNIGGNVGVAYSSNQRLQFLASGSIHFGKTERLILHAGFAMGRVKRIDLSTNNYLKVGEDYMLASPDVKFSSYNIVTFDKFVIKPFFGISYNLSKKNALQAVSGEGVSAYKTNFEKASD